MPTLHQLLIGHGVLIEDLQPVHRGQDERAVVGVQGHRIVVQRQQLQAWQGALGGKRREKKR